MRDLERELRRASFRVIEGGPATAATDPAVEAGPYFVTRDGMIAWRKETRDGSVPIPLCNFTAQIVAEEVLDDGAERRTVLAIEGAMPDGRRLPCARVPAERYPAMSWVTEAWGTAPVIFAGQGKKDHLRAAIQMLSGAVPQAHGLWSPRLAQDRRSLGLPARRRRHRSRWGARGHRGRHRHRRLPALPAAGAASGK